VRQVVITFIVTRLALLLTVIVALTLFHAQQCAVCGDSSSTPLLAGLSRWDGAAYLRIARDWYGGPDLREIVAYFPLYPALMRGLGAIAGGTDDAYLLAGIAISNAATLVAAIALRRLFEPRVDASVIATAVTLVLLFPTTIFHSAVYADALFLALAICSANAAVEGMTWPASALAVAAALTRPFGAVAVIPLAVRFMRDGLRPRSAILAVLLPPLAFAVWNAYLYAISGDPLMALHGYSSGFTPHSPLQAITDLFDPAVYGFPWFIGASFVLFVVLVVLAWRLTDPMHALFGTALLLVILAAGSLASSMRYELSIYPAFIALAWLIRRPVARIVWLTASSLVAILFAVMFALSYWIG